MSHPKTLQGSTDSETRAVTPICDLVPPTCGFFRLSAGARGRRALATIKNCTDARRTVKKTQIGVTQARAADSRQTKHKSSSGQNIANIFDPPRLGFHAPRTSTGQQKSYKTRRTVNARKKDAKNPHRSRQLLSYEPIGGKSDAADSIFRVPGPEMGIF